MNEHNSDAQRPKGSKPRVKRLKVVEACVECRTRKTKCDGDQPVCGPCRIRFGSSSDARCVYKGISDRASKSSNESASTMALEERVMDLERRLAEENGRLAKSHATANTKQPILQSQEVQNGVYSNQIHNQLRNRQSYHESLHDESEIPSEGSGIGLTNDCGPGQRHRNQEMHGESHVFDKNGETEPTSAILGAVHPEPAPQGFYGGSSVGSFMKQVRKIIEAKIKSPEEVKSPSSLLQDQQEMNMFFPHRKSGNSMDLDYSLPPRRLADSLVAIYWRRVHPLYPFLNRAQMMATYEDLWAGQEKLADESTYYCTLNAIFALACRFDDVNTISECECAAEKFFRRAKSSLNVWDASSLGSVQAFLLLGQYLQSTNDPHQCWTMIGLAVRTAQSIGLHLPETSERVSSPSLRGLIRTVWHGCVLMDRTAAMTYGRPVMVHKSIAGSVPLPLLADDAVLSDEDSSILQHGDSEMTNLDFFVESLKLFRVLYEILIRFYSSDPYQILNISTMSEYFLGRHDTQYEGRTVLALDRDLTDWQRNLPPWLKDLPSPKATDLASQQVIILHQRFLHVRILNLRPVLSAFVALEHSCLKETSFLDDTLTFRIGLQCSIICVQNAIEAIRIINYYLHNASEWWYNIMYLYTAATILVAARLQPLIIADISGDAIDNAWQRAISVLEEHEQYGRVVRRLLATIRLLAQQVPKSYMRYRQRNTNAAELRDILGIGASDLESAVPAASYNDIPSGNYAGINIPTNLDVTQGDEYVSNDFASTEFTFDPNDISWLVDIPLDF